MLLSLWNQSTYMNKRNMGYLLGKIGNLPKTVIDLPKDEATKNRRVAEILKQMVLKSRESRIVRLFALKLIREKGVAPKDYMGEIEALYTFVRDEIPYRKDAAFLDTFTEPEQQIKDFLFGTPSGDCDDKATLLASLLLVLGHVPRFVLTNNMPDGKYVHIYVEVKHPKENSWICLETTEAVELGWCCPTYKRGIITIINPKEQS